MKFCSTIEFEYLSNTKGQPVALYFFNLPVLS